MGGVVTRAPSADWAGALASLRGESLGKVWRMRMTESILIAADIATVWPWVADPVAHAEWNPKIVSIGRDRNGPVVTGERFEMSARIGTGRDREKLSRVEVVRVVPPTTVTFRHESAGRDGSGVIEDAYALEPEAGGTRLTQTVAVTISPWWAHLLVSFIARFGTSVDASPLENLKRCIERADAPPGAARR